MKSVTIKNFQSHRYSKFEFSPRVNSIIGASDQGKTSTLRGIRWAIDNKPGGFSFHSRFADKDEPTEVIIETIEGNTVRRYRDSKENVYYLNDEKLVGFGQEVPDVIKKILNLSEVNCQYQHDAPFLLSESPGVVARFLNQTVNLDKIDSSLKNISSIQRQNNQEITRLQTRLEELDFVISRIPDLNFLSGIISDLEIYDSLRSLNRSKIEILKKVTREIESCQDRLNTLIIPEVDFTEIENNFNRRTEINKQLSGLTMLIININRKEETLSDIVRTIRKWEEELQQKTPSVCPFCGASLRDGNGMLFSSVVNATDLDKMGKSGESTVAKLVIESGMQKDEENKREPSKKEFHSPPRRKRDIV